MSVAKAAEFINANDRFLLSSHVNPDGDGIGAILGIASILSKLKKDYAIIFQDAPQVKLSFLEGFNEIKVYDDSMEGTLSFKAAIVADSPHKERVGGPLKLLDADPKILNIDHHVGNNMYGTVNLVIADAAASSEILVSVYDELGITIEKGAAQALYTGICVDTGGFRHANTSAHVHQVASRLVEAGAQPAVVSNFLYQQNTFETTIGLGKAVSSIEIHNNGKIATAFLDYDFLSTEEGMKMDSEGFVNYPLGIHGVEVAFLIQEPQKGKSRVSLRSNTDFDVNKLAQKFGGGGHAKAAGARIEGTSKEVKEKLLKAANGLI